MKRVILLAMMFIISGCYTNDKDVHNVETSNISNINTISNKGIHTDETYSNWLSINGNKVIDKSFNEYQKYINSKLNFKVDVRALGFNRSIAIKYKETDTCYKYMYSVPIKDKWVDILSTLKLIEKLKVDNVIDFYIYRAGYRNNEANKCVNGAKYSKHLNNNAVDIMIPDTQDSLMKLCNFYHKNGNKYKLGLGTYNIVNINNIKYRLIHIDTNGYRTWGHTYKRDSSLCLQISF